MNEQDFFTALNAPDPLEFTNWKPHSSAESHILPETAGDNGLDTIRQVRGEWALTEAVRVVNDRAISIARQQVEEASSHVEAPIDEPSNTG